MADQYFPRLSSVVQVNDLPEQLGFLQNFINDFFDKYYFRNLQVSRSKNGEKAFYSLIFITYDRIGVEIPGTGLALLLNPPRNSDPNPYFAEFPMQLHYELEVLKYIKGFDINQFAQSPAAFFNLLLKITGFTERQLLQEAIDVFGTGQDPVNDIIDQVNDFFNTNFPYPPTGTSDKVAFFLNTLQTQLNTSVGFLIFSVFISTSQDIDTVFSKMGSLFSRILGGSPIDFVKKLFIPKISAKIDLSIGLQFPRTVLIPIDPNNNEPFDDQSGVKSMLLFNAGTVRFSTEGGIGFDQNIVADLNYPSQIGKTGLIINLEKAKLDLSKKYNIQEATDLGYSDDFIGVYIKEASITLPEKWFKNQDETTAKIVGEGIVAGTGGFNGTLKLEATGTAPAAGEPVALTINLGQNDGFQIGFVSFSMQFKQNSIVSSSIKGFLKIPGFEDAAGNPARIDIEVYIGNDGEFRITASEDNAINLIRIKDLLEINLKSLTIGRTDGKFYIAVSGSLDFLDQTGKGGDFIKDKLPKQIAFQDLRIWQNGKVEFKKAGLKLREPVSLNLGSAITLTVSAIHLGSHEQLHQGVPRSYKMVGFDGGVSMSPGGVEARGKGIKAYFTTDGLSPRHVFVRIQSIAIDLMIPGDVEPEEATLLLSGYLSIKEPNDPNDPTAGKEFAGGVSFSLPQLQIEGSAKMRLNPTSKAFLVDIGLSLPVPIPIGPTGIGAYAFRAILGSKYVATKAAAGLQEEDLWYQYYKAKVEEDYKVGIQPGKFELKPGFSLGAGVSLATTGDSGKVFSAKVVLLLSLPELMLLIEGQGQIMKDRIPLDSSEEPPFYALIVITKESIETALGVNYKLPEEGPKAGQTVRVDGLIEMAFFFGDSTGWYVNIGRDFPENKRVQARILDLFDCYFYFMIAASGIRLGAGASFELDKKIGPFGVEVRAYIDIAAKLSFKPKQFGGSLQFGGSAKLRIFKFKFGLAFAAGVAGETPLPFIVDGFAELCVKVFRKKKCVKVNLTWIKDTAYDDTPLPLMDPLTGAKAENILTGEGYDLLYLPSGALSNPSGWAAIEPIPMDSYLTFEFKNPVNATGTSAQYLGANNGAENITVIPPQRAKTDQIFHQFYVDSIDIQWFHPTNGWEPYHIYEAMTAFDTALFPQLSGINLSSFKNGAWQLDHPRKLTKLKVLSQNPLAYVAAGGNPPESFNVTAETIFCESEKREKVCINFENEGGNNTFPSQQWVHKNAAMLWLEGQDGTIVNRSYLTYQNALRLNEKEQFWISFNEAVNCIDLQIQTETNAVKVSWFKLEDTGNVDANGVAVYDYFQHGATQNFYSNELNQVIRYEDAVHSIDKVLIEAGDCQSLEWIETLLEFVRQNSPANLWMVPRFFYQYQSIITHPILSGIFSSGSVSYAPSYDLQNNLFSFELKKSNQVFLSVTLDIDNLSTFSFANVLTILPVLSTDNNTFSGRLDGVNSGNPFAYNFTGYFDPNVIGTNLLANHPNPINNLVCTTDYGAMEILLDFLNGLMQQGYLQNQGNSSLQQTDFPTTFWGTNLYTGNQSTIYANTQISGNRLELQLNDETGYSCTIELEFPFGDYNFGQIILFNNLRLDPYNQVNGQSFVFLVDVVLELTNNGNVIKRRSTLRGTSCYPLADCEETPCATYLYDICYLNKVDYLYNISIPPQSSIDTDNLAMVEALNKAIQPVWMPNSCFAITITGRDIVSRGSNTSPNTQSYTFGFKTAGGPGFFHNYLNGANFQDHEKFAALAATEDQDAFRLKNLNHYVDYPKCFPNADGVIPGAKPLYYKQPELRLFFIKQYIIAMYSPWADAQGNTLWDYALEVKVFDPAEEIPISLEAEWVRFDFPVIDQQTQTLNNMIQNGNPCSSVQDITTFGIVPVFNLPDLKPNKTYAALFNGVFKENANTHHRRDIHQYVFASSLYGDFYEHIYSYRLFDAAGNHVRDAVFDINAADTLLGSFSASDIAATGSIVANTMANSDPLIIQFIHPYDRIIDGTLKLGALPPAVTTEFNIIRNNTDILGVCLRSTEPINDSKTPTDVLLDTIELQVDGGAASDFKVVFSKDIANAFISNADGAMNMPTGTYRFTFRYKLFNGQSYDEVAMIDDVEFDVN